MSQDWYKDVLDFHEKFDRHRQDAPALPPTDVAKLRLDLVLEEVREYCDAMVHKDLVQIADAIGDSIYVLIGAAIAYGIDLRPVWDEIHRSNMAKSKDNMRADGKILKPPGWQPPDIAAILKAQRDSVIAGHIRHTSPIYQEN